MASVIYYNALAASGDAAAICCCCQRRARPVRFHALSARGIVVAARLAHSPDHARATAAPDRQGKVRDIYDFGDRLLIVATDRISAFDYVLGSGIPDKGKVLTQISAFWFDRTRAIVAEPSCSRPIRRRIPAAARPTPTCCAGRSMLVTADRAAADRMRRARLPVGLGLEGLLGHRRGLRHSRCRPACASRIGCPQPIFTPATKAQSGHDINISEAEAAALVGTRRARRASAT